MKTKSIYVRPEQRIGLRVVKKKSENVQPLKVNKFKKCISLFKKFFRG